MKKVQEYKILPQAERGGGGGGGNSGGHYSDDEYQYGSSSRNNCLGSFLIILTAIFILVGSTALIITAFWSKEFHSTLDLYWPNHPISGSHSQAIWLEQNNSSSSSSSSSSAPAINSTEFPVDLSHNSTSGEESSESGEIEGHHRHNGTSHNKTNSTDTDTDMEINETNIGLKFAEAMRQFEKQMEKLSGIHQAELVIPLFMLVTFMSTLALISLCCCLMSKRREHRQRKLLGKIITDLQTGDSKTILLGSKDEDF